MLSSSDRRAYRRVPCLTTVRAVGDAGTVEGRATNISEGGLYLQHLCCAPLCPGEHLHLELDLPGGPLEVMGRVVKPADEVFYQAGAIAFTALSEEGRGRLRRFVDHRAQRRPIRGAPIARLRLIRKGR